MDIFIKFKIFDMNSVLPYITLYYPITKNSKIKNNKNSNYDLFILNSDSIRNFICENYNCDTSDTIEEIIFKNFKNKNYYQNFSKNLMNYINRKNFNPEEFSLNENLKGYLKPTSILKSENKNYENFLKEDLVNIKKFLTGIEK